MIALERLSAAEFPGRLPELQTAGHAAVITGMFPDTALSRIVDVESLRALLGDEPTSIGTNYVDMHLERVRRFQRGIPMLRGHARVATTVGDCIDRLNGNDQRVIVTEQPTPERLLRDLDLSGLGVRTIVGADVDPYAPNMRDVAYSLMFMAGPGNASDMHMDGDGRDVMLHQVFGHKRACLFPASAAPLLHPVGPYATVRLAGMDDAERRAFLAYAGGVEHLLSPGETLFMPAFIWHHLEYLDVSMSIGFRFAGIEDPIAQTLIRTVHLDHYVSRIIVGTRNPATAEASRAAAQRVLDTAAHTYPSARAKYRAVRAAAATHLPAAGQRRADAFIDVEEFLEGGLAGFYSRSPAGPGRLDRMWHFRERVRDQVRRRARRLAYWA
jgi:hypothetical protein